MKEKQEKIGKIAMFGFIVVAGIVGILYNNWIESGWLFKWKTEFAKKERDIYKLTIVNNPSVIQGLISLEVREDHVYMHLVENAPFNRGENKVYSGVAGNLTVRRCGRICLQTFFSERT